MALQILKNDENNQTVLTLSGRVDGVTSAELQTALDETLAENKNDIIINLHDVAYISSAGLRVLLSTEKRCRPENRRQIIKGVNSSVMEIFDLTGFSGILTVE